MIENMNNQVKKLWNKIVEEINLDKSDSEMARDFLQEIILNKSSFQEALAARVASKICNQDFNEKQLELIFNNQMSKFPAIYYSAAKDLLAFYGRDPACNYFYQPLLYYKGFIALQTYRISRVLFKSNDTHMALYLQMRASEVFGVDIHPGASIGSGIMLDHAHNIVIGETAVVGNQVSMLHAVTLGGTGKSKGDRHPKIGNGVLIGAGAKILGNITVGNCSRIAAGSVVLKSVPSCKTVAGVPAREVGDAGCPEPAKTMNQLLKTEKV